jgi:hypothetical protein
MSFSMSLANAATFVFLIQVCRHVKLLLGARMQSVHTMLRSFLSSAGQRPPSTRCKLNHPEPCVLWPVRSWGLRPYVEEVEEAHSAECP